MQIIPVDPGTTLRDPDTGDEAMVDDEHFVVRGNTMWVTHKTFEALKAIVPSRDAKLYDDGNATLADRISSDTFHF